MSLEEAQTLIMTARVQLGWVALSDLEQPETEAEDDLDDGESEE